MINEFCEIIIDNKQKIIDHFKKEDYVDYESIFKYGIALIPGLKEESVTIADGGMLDEIIFLVQRGSMGGAWFITDTYQGSCSGCDTVERINELLEDNKQQACEDIYLLILHLFQRMKIYESAD